MVQYGWNLLQGKSIQIDKMTLISSEGIHLTIMCRTEREHWIIDFKNVSVLNICEFSFPMMIHGLEIQDNLCRGWESCNRFKVCDFEEETISFLCQDIHVSITDIIS